MLIKLIKWASNFHAFLVVICLYTFLLPYFLQEETHQVEVKMSNDDVLGDEIPLTRRKVTGNSFIGCYL